VKFLGLAEQFPGVAGTRNVVALVSWPSQRKGPCRLSVLKVSSETARKKLVGIDARLLPQ
jgi:hypothetical protein